MKTDVQQKFDSYPKHIKPLLLSLRALVLTIAKEQNLGNVEETLNWGEPSYLAKDGSAIRFDWKPKYPEQYCLYFNCQTKLVDTFRELYADVLTFEGNRAIVLKVNDDFPNKPISHCIELSLRYKKIKHLPYLGV